MQIAGDKKRALWEQRIQQWQASEQSGAQFCREHDLPYHVFGYWVHRLKQKDLPPTFVELTDTAIQTGISLEVHGVTIHLKQDFCKTTFTQLLTLLARC